MSTTHQWTAGSSTPATSSVARTIARDEITALVRTCQISQRRCRRATLRAAAGDPGPYLQKSPAAWQAQVRADLSRLDLRVQQLARCYGFSRVQDFLAYAFA